MGPPGASTADLFFKETAEKIEGERGGSADATPNFMVTHRADDFHVVGGDLFGRRLPVVEVC